MVVTRAWRRTLAAGAVVGAVGILRLAALGSSLPPGPGPSPSASLLRVGEAPWIEGSSALCPIDAPYHAYRSTGTYFPPDHPALPPPAVGPTRCFARPVEAESAGYSLAPPPPGVEVAGGAYLLPTEPALVDQCRQAARRLGFAVPCPGLLPARERGAGPVRCGAGPIPDSMRGCVYTNFLPGQRHSLFLLDENIVAVPPTYAWGLFPTVSAVELEAYPAGIKRTAERGSFLACFPTHVESSVRVRLGPGVFARCSGDSSQRLTLRIRPPSSSNQPFAEISVAGPLAADHRLLTAIADRVRMVGP